LRLEPTTLEESTLAALSGGQSAGEGCTAALAGTALREVQQCRANVFAAKRLRHDQPVQGGGGTLRELTRIRYMYETHYRTVNRRDIEVGPQVSDEKAESTQGGTIG
jgi:hypothetical protein